MLGSLLLIVQQMTLAHAGTEPSVIAAWTNHLAQWPCEPGVPNCCAYLKTTDLVRDEVWVDPPKDLVLKLEVTGNPREPTPGETSFFNPQELSINKAREDSEGNIKLDPQPLIEGEFPGQWYFIVDEEVPYMACILDHKKRSIGYFQSKGCHRDGGKCAAESVI